MSFFKNVEVESETKTTRWINDDIRPIEAGRRTWTYWTFSNYCMSHHHGIIQRLTLASGVLINSNISTYLTGSSLIALGLTWWEAIICKCPYENNNPKTDSYSDCHWQYSCYLVRRTQFSSGCILPYWFPCREQICLGNVWQRFRDLESYPSLSW